MLLTVANLAKLPIHSQIFQSILPLPAVYDLEHSHETILFCLFDSPFTLGRDSL